MDKPESTGAATALELRLARDVKKFLAQRSDPGTAYPKTAQRPQRETSAIRVVLSVRHRDLDSGAAYGNAIRWVYVAKNELSTLGAEVDARKKAREDGFVVWAVLEITVVETGEV